MGPEYENTMPTVYLPSLAGCACRFLYGPETKDEHKAQVEKSLDGKIELKLEVIFYKKNGKSGILIKSAQHPFGRVVWWLSQHHPSNLCAPRWPPLRLSLCLGGSSVSQAIMWIYFDTHN